MDEYIKKEEAMHIAFKSPFFSDSLMEEIKAIPAADVAPVRHGRWNLYERAHYFKCSLCAKTVPYRKACLFDGRREYNYCPNCGARMDE